MNEAKKPTALEETVNRTLRRRRLVVGVGVIVFLAVFAAAGFLFWSSVRPHVFTPPVYPIDPESETYWRDRTMADLQAVAPDEPPAQRIKIVHPRLRNTIAEARRLPSSYEQITAVCEIATTMAVNDEDMSIDNVLRELGDTSFAQAMYARVLVSQALMYIRLGNVSAARVSLQEYRRVSIESDLKLDSDVNTLSFTGAVTGLDCLGDKGQLTEMFNRQMLFTLRIPPVRRSTAFRILAGEQARVGMPIPAMVTARRIDNPVERVRAFQLIISLSARPPKIVPTEPEPTLPKTEGPWTPELIPTVARQVVDEVLTQVAETGDLGNQINLLLRLAGSRLMCDPDLYRIFKDAVAESRLDELVKRPVLKILSEPESDAIRLALGMPPVVRERPRNIDPATDDWSTPYGSISVDLVEIAPEMVQTLIDVQTLRSWLMTAQSYQMVARYRDAGDVMRRTAPIARRLTHPVDRITYLLLVGEKQISVGRTAEARETLSAVGLPPKSTETAATASPAATASGRAPTVREVFTPERLSTLARLQTLARYFEDALETLDRLDDDALRDGDLEFLAQEQIRVRLFDDAERTIARMTPSPRTEELRHITAIGLGGGEEHFTALDIPFPARLNRDVDVRRCCEMLFLNGLLGPADKVAEKIIDKEARINMHRRIAREYMLIFRGYRDNVDFHRSVRRTLLAEARAVAGKIEDVRRRALLLESVLTDALPYSKDDGATEVLKGLYEKALADCRGIETANEEKAELLGKLLVAKVELETAGRQGKLPPDESMTRAIEETLLAINEADDSPNRGFAISSLAQSLARLGRNRQAAKMVEEAQETVREITRPRDAVSVLLSLIPTLKILDDEETTKQVFYAAFTITSETFVGSVRETEKVYEWRIRDSELDRIVRSQLEYGFLKDAVDYSARIEENLLRERLLRTAAYIYLDQGDPATAEALVRRIKLEDIRTDALRDILFLKRQMEKTENGTTNEPAETAEGTEESP